MRSIVVGLVALALSLAGSLVLGARAEAQCVPGASCVAIVQPGSRVAVVTPPSTALAEPMAADQPETRTRPRWGLVVAGSVMTIAAYGLNLAGSALWYSMSIFTGQSDSYFHGSLVPVVGPFVQMAYVGNDTWQIPILAIAGAAQTLGIVLAIVGTASREEVLARPSVAVAPYASPDGAGATFVGAW